MSQRPCTRKSQADGKAAVGTRHGGFLGTPALPGSLLAVTLAIWMAGCVSGPSGSSRVLSAPASVAASVADALNSPRGRSAVAAGASLAQDNTAAPQAGAEPPAAPAQTGAEASPRGLRPALSLQGLFAKGQVNGAELLTELIAVRTLMKDRRSAAAVGALLGPAPSSGAAGGAAGGFDPRAEALKIALKSGEEAIKPYVSSIGFGALDLHLKTMIDDPKLLASEQIKLPSSRGMSQAQMQRVVNMAAILAATRVTARILKKAQEDFANVESDYTRLITRREAAAQVLYDLLLKGTGPSTQLAGAFDEADLRYLNDNLRRMSVKDFANDLGAQNLALRHLRQTDPTAWADYKARSDGLLSSTKGYIRATAGVTAFSALLANFGNETLGAISKNKTVDILGAMPFAWEFVKEVPPLLKTSWQVGAAGVIELPMKANKRFRVVEGSAATDLSRAGEVFATVKKKGAEPIFNEALFRTGADGLLYKLYRCDKSEVGRMLDVAVPMAEREKFAAKVVPGDTVRFSFANAFNAPEPAARAQDLGDEMLRRDHRERSDAANGVALGEAQRAATKGAANWNNDQLLRLILANREGVAAHATLQLGDLLVRPVPSMQSVYAYESLIDECAQQFGGGPKSAASAGAAPVSAGQAKPAALSQPAARPASPARPPATKPANKTGN